MDPVQVDDLDQPVNDVQVDDPVQPVNDVQVDPIQVDDHAQLINDVPAQPVATGKRIRKYSERITEIGLRMKVLKKEGSIDHHPMVLE
ncbi:unnamed protein product [Lactuca virosa]|uniref:Uncharacterized protein n=1 Tax=Lactuca virosa TaxID=75947 RepID=A0AAU9LL41_9ASTR|nr:unnamed protein product [Lactuca virosa]